MQVAVGRPALRVASIRQNVGFRPVNREILLKPSLRQEYMASFRIGSEPAMEVAEVAGTDHDDSTEPFQMEPYVESCANVVIMTGTIVKDPQSRKFQNGKTVSNFLIRARRPAQKQKVDAFVCEAWDDLALRCMAHLKPGMRIQVHGYMIVEKFKDKAGVQKKDCRAVVERLQVVDPDTIPAALDVNTDEERWELLREHPEQFWDNRELVEGKGRGPAFLHKSTGDVVWADNKDTPAWFTEQDALGQVSVEELPPQLRKSGSEELWRELQAAPGHFWDNRSHKFSERAPDFTYKATGAGLFCDNTPEWFDEASLEGLSPKGKVSVEDN